MRIFQSVAAMLLTMPASSFAAEPSFLQQIAGWFGWAAMIAVVIFVGMLVSKGNRKALLVPTILACIFVAPLVLLLNEVTFGMGVEGFVTVILMAFLAPFVFIISAFISMRTARISASTAIAPARSSESTTDEPSAEILRWEKFVSMQFSLGFPPQNIKSQLIGRGVSENDAEILVSRVLARSSEH